MKNHQISKEEMIELYLKNKGNKTQKQFATEKNINYNTLKNWLWKYRTQLKRKDTKIIEIKPSQKRIEPSSKTQELLQPTRIALSNGIELQAPVTSVEQLVRLINGLQS